MYNVIKYNKDNCKVKSKCYAITYKDVIGNTHVTYPMTKNGCTEWLRARKERDNG